MKKLIKNVASIAAAASMLATAAASVGAEAADFEWDGDAVITKYIGTPVEETNGVYLPEGSAGVADLAFASFTGDHPYVFVPGSVTMEGLANTSFVTTKSINDLMEAEGIVDEDSAAMYVAKVIRFADKTEGWTDEELETVKEWFTLNLSYVGISEGDTDADVIIKLIAEYNKGEDSTLEMSQKSKDNFGIWIATLPVGVTIVADEGTDVAAYADAKGIDFKVKGDNNGDGKLNVRDAASIAAALANADKEGFVLNNWSDYNTDGKVNVRDAAAIANMLANTKG